MAFQPKVKWAQNGPTGDYVNHSYEHFPEEDTTYKISDDEDDDVDTFTDSSEGDGEVFPEKTGSPPEFGTAKKRISKKKKIKKANQWDVFRETSEDNLSSSEISFWNSVLVVTKIIFSLILFCFVLGAGLVSKSTLFVIIANILPPSRVQNSTLKSADNHLQFATSETGITWIWSLVLIVVAPYAFTLFMSLWRLTFKKTRALEVGPLVVALGFETTHTVGMSLFAFAVLPNLDPVAGLLICTNVTLLPALFRLIYSGDHDDKKTESPRQKIVRLVTTAVAISFGVLSLAFWAYYCYKMDADRFKDSPGLVAMFVISPLLVSVYWWENFVPQGKEYSVGLQKLKRQLRSRRTKISAIVSAWKIVLTIVMVTVIYSSSCDNGSDCVRTLYNTLTNATMTSSTFGKTPLVENTLFGTCSAYIPLILAAVNIVATGVCYRCCAAACKILAQIPSYSLPLTLMTPFTLAIMLGVLMNEDIKMTDGCSLPFPRWHGDIVLDWALILAAFLGYIALLGVTNYVWKSSRERMQREEKLFVQPFYCGVLFDQSMLLNRRKDDDEDMQGVDEKEGMAELPIPENLDKWQPGEGDWSPLRQDDTPFIYLCATMWHETENEMTQILKSLFRMDEDQCARRNLQLFFGIRDPDYYEFEAHIFFDDAFDYDGDETRANGYVKQLIRTIDVAVGSVHAFGMKIPPPTKLDTPYGGRLIWRLPGGNKMIAHLKDKAKIRHRKRWSQVMYMYYFLGHKLLSMGGGKERIKTIASNTFLLALDGDVDFQPAALRLLVDRMKRNPNVGAACGRIHPIGSGPMVWYQKFEYAVSHWLQKATEHIIGCVLCSPGCFSLFRGASVMDDNVMRRYTTPPTEARHYVQYDQGEDRWLCTLLLQQGYRVEYCAASDALTYAPEGFYEFYNQRRRWTPSTMANILDLLLDWKNVTKKNNDISMPYIAYQMLLMVSSILTPGTIFLLVLGAINTAYPALSLYWSLILNLAPVIIFILLCYTAKGNIQLAYAAILSTVYSLVMMLVIVGLIKQAADNGFCSITTIFLCGVAGIFVISAFIHPQEFWCIIHGFLYFLAIPSMSMLLMLYSLCNLHVVSWGTRETPKPAAAPKAADAQKPTEAKGVVHDWLSRIGLVQSLGKSDYVFSFGNLFRCLCCPKETTDTEDLKLHAILDRLDAMEAKVLDQAKSDVSSEISDSDNESQQHVHFSETAELFEGAKDRDDLPKKSTPWIQDSDLLDGDMDSLQPEETGFWKEMIDTYLYPMEGNKQQQEKTQEELIELRNTVCLFFLLINAMFVVIVFSLQQVNADSDGSLAIELWCATGGYGEAIEPISFAFTLVFGVLLVIQFICMIFHRMSTFLHICSITEIKGVPKQLQQDGEEELSVDKGLKLVRDMQGVKEDDTKSVISQDDVPAYVDEDLSDKPEGVQQTAGKDLWGKIARRRREQQFGTLSQNFVRNFKKLQKHIQDEEEGSQFNLNVASTGGRNQLSSISEEGDGENDQQRLETVSRKFRRLERKSIFTIVKLSRDPRIKKSILERGKKVANKWQRAALLIKLQRAGATGSNSGHDGGRKPIIEMADIANLTIVNQKIQDDVEGEFEEEKQSKL